MRTGTPALLALTAVLLCGGVRAEAAGVSCHCFRDRAYDPASPARTDAYLLATASNTLLAAAHGFPKGRIVRERMSGASSEELWIAVYAASRLGVEPDALRLARAETGSWRDAVARARGTVEGLDPAFLAALAGGRGDADLARAAVTATAVAHLGTRRAELSALASGRATLQETVLAALLGAWSGRPPTGVFEEVRGGAVAWSAVLNRLGLVPTDLERKIPETLGKPLP